jgi:hypothetical protein
LKIRCLESVAVGDERIRAARENRDAYYISQPSTAKLMAENTRILLALPRAYYQNRMRQQGIK